MEAGQLRKEAPKVIEATRNEGQYHRILQGFMEVWEFK